MESTAEIFFHQGRQAIRLPEGMHLDATDVRVRQEKPNGDIVLSTSSKAPASETFANFFKLLEEIGPAEEEFMWGVEDPPLSPENIF